MITVTVNSAGGTVTVPTPGGFTTPALTITIPPGATSSTVTITATALQVINNPQQLPSNVPPPPLARAGGTTQISAVFTLDATVAGGEHVDAVHPFAQAVTLTMPVPAETLAAAAGSGDTIVLAFFNEVSHEWQEVPTTVVDGVLTAQVLHFSRWALIVHTPQQAHAPLPVQPSASSPGPPATGNAGLAASSSSLEDRKQVAALGLLMLGLIAAARYLTRAA